MVIVVAAVVVVVVVCDGGGQWTRDVTIVGTNTLIMLTFTSLHYNTTQHGIPA